MGKTGLTGAELSSRLAENDRLLTPAEVAELFHVTTGTVATWRRAGRIASVPTPGGQARYRTEDVRALLASWVPPETDTRCVTVRA